MTKILVPILPQGILRIDAIKNLNSFLGEIELHGSQWIGSLDTKMRLHLNYASPAIF